MKNFETVYTAWDGERPIGLICAMDDGIMTAYVHYLPVRPEYQGQGIGKQIVNMIKEKYRDYLRVVLAAENDKIGFYEPRSFKKAPAATAMFITDLWT